jgi:flavodoxin I
VSFSAFAANAGAQPAAPRLIGLFYGSTNGNTRQVAGLIEQTFTASRQATVELLDIAEFYLEEMIAFDQLILGVSTWNTGQLQKDWERIYEEFDQLDLTGKQVALFGLGDQHGYPDTFGDALFFLASKVQERGAVLVGRWPITGYTFRQSWAVEGDHFLGLLLDEESQADLTAIRVEQWVAQLLDEFTHRPS